MGKHEAPVPPRVERVHWIVRICTHHGMHAASTLVLHIAVMIAATPILIAMGFGGGGSHV
jgi:hypothetical protein